MKFPSCIAVSFPLVLVACTSATVTPSGVAMPSTLVDPLRSPDAPPLVPFKNIKTVFQPPPPRYPEAALAGGIHGDVVVEVWINTEGIPIKSTSLFGPKELLHSASEYAQGWKFSPVLSNGTPTAARFRLVMPFRLRVGGVYRYAPKEFVY